MPDHVPGARRTRLYTFCRYFVAYYMCFYGFAKIFLLQFFVPESTLDMPLGGVDGQALVWAFFGHSDAYRWVIALGEITAGVLLLFRRTTLLGAVLLVPMLANIIVIDVIFGISAYVTVGILSVMVGVILNAHWTELRHAFWEIQSTVYCAASSPVSRGRRFATCALRIAVVLVPAFVACQGRPQTHPRTAIDGKWRVDSIARPAGIPATPAMLDSAEVIYFEPEFGPRSVFRRGDSFEPTYFSIDEASRALRIHGRSRRQVQFDGRYTVAGDSLRLTGTSAGRPVELLLRRED